jgi:molybdopterin converting factor subunit 1
MKIQVRYFAVFRERLGREEEALELDEGADVAAALALLGARHPAIAQLAGRFQIAVNQEMAPPSTPLHDGDELALIPPVAGGSDGRHARVVAEVPSLDRCVAAVTGPSMGGVVTFTGVVRARNRGLDVERLEYEAYAEMAEKVMRGLCDEIEAELPGCRLAVEHRVGTLAVGDVAVVIAAAAPHRGEAFTACRAMIDRLKDRVPIWKKEVTPDGSSWIGLGP